MAERALEGAAQFAEILKANMFYESAREFLIQNTKILRGQRPTENTT